MRCARHRQALRLVYLSLLCCLAYPAHAWNLRGHVKPQASIINLPADSLLQDFSDDPSLDTGLDLRANLADARGNWSWQIDYQLLARQGDQLKLSRLLDRPGYSGAGLPDDARRVFDLTHIISESDDRLVEHRLDRLYLGHTSGSTAIKIGRQAISWGNGLIYNPVDFFNPFDPSAIDTEYKTGDDMLYAQYLFPSGDDLQAVWVGRRDEAGDISSDVASMAAKYHVFSGTRELDLLAARHYDESIVAVGGSLDLAEAIWRADLMLTDGAEGTVTSAVVNWSYSLLAWQKNMTVVAEYFHNGFGISDGDYAPPALAENPGLTARILRGELFTLAQNYFAAAATVELTPLWLFTTSLFNNLDDNSRLLQLSSQHDLQQDLQLLLALNLPTGDQGSEFGGIDSGIEGRPLALGTSAFAQLAWYF